MILTVTLNASIDRTLFVDGVNLHDTNRVAKTEVDAGGKGLNLSRVAHELGAATLATGFWGGGPGEAIRHVLDQEGVAHRMVGVAEPTRVNVTIESGDGPPTSFNERGPTVSEDETSRFLAHYSALLAELGSGWVCLCGSAPPGIPTGIYADLGRKAKQAGWRVFLDADGDLLREGMRCNPDLVKPNQDEAARFLDRAIDNDEDAANAASELLGRLDIDGVAILSQGKLGAILASNGKVLKGKTPQVEVTSTIGSGDSMMGGVLSSIERGETWEEAFRWGLAAGAATATTNGSEIARRSVIELLYRQATIIPL